MLTQLRQRRLSFSLKTLLICVTTACIVTAVAVQSWQAVQLRDQRARYKHTLRNGDGYEKVTTLQEAVAVLHRQLDADDRSQYVNVLTIEQIRRAFQMLIKTTDASLDKLGSDGKAAWQDKFRPVCVKIVEQDQWPSGYAFLVIYSNEILRQDPLDDDLDLTLLSPDNQALSIFKVQFGHNDFERQ